MQPIGDETAKASLRRLLGRVSRILDTVGSRFPLFARRDEPDGWETTADGNWCAGYWIGLLWLAAHHAESASERARYRRTAHALLPAMLSQRTDNLFAGLNHYYAGYLGFDLTGEEQLRAIGLRGAIAVRDLYDARARQIPIGTYETAPPFASRFRATMPSDRRFVAAVDAVHTCVPVLLRAFRETGDPVFRDVAMAHAARHLEWHLRADGSSVQMTAFDPESGRPTGRFNPLAAGPDGCWSRGLGWSIAGLVSLYVATGDQVALKAVSRSVDYYRAHVDETLVPAWDFTAGPAGTCRDASAAAVTAYGLINLKARSSAATRELELAGAGILAGLIGACQIDDPGCPNIGGIVHGCYRFPENTAIDNELIWGDFYVAAALHRLLSTDASE